MTYELFTPGPWLLDQVEPWTVYNTEYRGVMSGRDGGRFTPSNHHDWFLIAAAPELYDLVKKLVEHCPDATLARRAYTTLKNARGEY